MKQVFDRFYSIAAIAICSLGSNCVDVKSAQALEEGLYWGGGSRYISIFKQANSKPNSTDNLNTSLIPEGDRYCYMGTSSNGTMIASLNLKIPRYQTGIDYEVYTLQGLSNLAIQQYAAKRDQIIFGKLVGRFVRGGLVYQREGDGRIERSPELQACLNSRQPYFKQILSGRDRR
ncbi:hypothetical protein [Pseudanabaena mucicola]|uniref:Uncharacterized protein n=1 Tax=Pseudanabaena mucicola FACHB-723 TaxID=2692860 RepID=A0ABR7ZWH2_9CYAN|nr:hypothetical protein [Pseudanabaena mucicola]MBD2188114.1 hypothetical protein [Pseudanabaena mucicola FACHB-723]